MSVDINITTAKDQNYFTHTGTTNYTGWYGPFTDVFNPTTVVTVLNQLIAVPVMIARPCNLDEIVIEVTASGTAGSVIRLGIYQDGGNVFPTTLLLDAGTVTGDSNAVKTISINQNITTAGLYWLAFFHNSAAAITVRAVPATTGATPTFMGIGKTTFTSGAPNRILAALAYAVLPTPFPTTGLTISNSTIVCPLIHKSAFL